MAKSDLVKSVLREQAEAAALRRDFVGSHGCGDIFAVGSTLSDETLVEVRLKISATVARRLFTDSAVKKILTA